MQLVSTGAKGNMKRKAKTKAKTKGNMKRKAKSYTCVCSLAAFGRDARS